MRINKKTNRPKKLLLLSSVVVVFLVIAGAIIWWQWSSNDVSQNSADSPKEQQKSQRDSGGDSSNTPSTPSTTENNNIEREKEKEIPPQHEGPSPDASSSLTGSINYSAVAGNNLIIRTTINQTVNSGTCSLSLTSGSKNVTRSSNIAQNPSSATCEGFDIPVSELGTGTWNITININGDGKTGSLTGSVTI